MKYPIDRPSDHPFSDHYVSQIPLSKWEQQQMASAARKTTPKPVTMVTPRPRAVKSSK